MVRNTLTPSLILGLSILGGASLLAASRTETNRAQGAGGLPSEAAASAKTYEELATAIIGIEKAEDELVRTILIGYHTAAQRYLKMAAEGANKKQSLERAAAEISNVANEGDGPIRAVRQRLAQAGHTHNTDAETKEDYMFVTNKEKRELLAFAQKVSQMSGASDAEIKNAASELEAMVAKALADESTR